jgi:hypothetical protein
MATAFDPPKPAGLAQLKQAVQRSFQEGPAYRGSMPFSTAPYDAHTIGLMTAALETAWMGARLSVPGMSHVDRANMERAILNAVALGERDFKQLQQHAIDALGARALEQGLKPVERRERLRLVEGAVDRRRK